MSVSLKIYLMLSIALLSMLILPLGWDRLCGNTPFQFYGRLTYVDRIPVVGASVPLVITKGTELLVPVPFTNHKRQSMTVNVITDNDGNFCLKRYSALFLVVELGNINIAGKRAEPEWPPRAEFSFDFYKRTAWNALPLTPDRRITYVVDSPHE